MSDKPRYANPFLYYNQPVRGKYFFGRNDLLRKIFTYINAGKSVSLVGERYTGKTSILLRVLDLKEQALREPSQHLLVFQDFLGLQYCGDRELWVILLTTLSEEVARAGLETNGILSAIKQLQLGSLLFSTLFKVFATLRHDGYKVTFLFDEFEVTASEENPLDLSFYKLLRNLAIDEQTRLSYLITTRQSLSNVERFVERKFTSLSTPLFNIFKQLIIQPFSEDEAHQMVSRLLLRTSLSLGTKLYFWLQRHFLFELCSFHPFFLQRACYLIYEHCLLSDGTFAASVPQEEIVNALLNDSISHFESYWQSSSTREQQVLRKLATAQALDWQSMLDVRRRLQTRSLIVQTDSGWRLFSSAFTLWVNEIAPTTHYQLPRRSQAAYDFVSREQELSKLFALLERYPYLHLYGTSGIGKTELIVQLAQKHYAEQPIAYLDFNNLKFAPQSRSTQNLWREIERQLYNSTPDSAVSLSELMTNFSLIIRETSRYGVVVLDNIHHTSPEIRRQLREEVLPALQDRIADPTLYLRVIAISQSEIKELGGFGHISFQPYPLAPFATVRHDLATYQALLRQAVTRWGKEPLEPDNAKANDLLKRWANQLYNLTAGHPAAIEATLNYVGHETQLAEPNVFETQQQALCQHVLTPRLERQLQASFPMLPDYQRAFRQLWVFRYLSKGVLQQLLTEVKGKPDWHDVNSITDKVESLWERLTDTPLLRPKGIDEQRLLSHQLAPIWRHQGNLILQATNPSLYQRLHKEARTVFEHFAFTERMHHTKTRLTCFVEVLYHLTQEVGESSSQQLRHDLTQDVIAHLKRFLSVLKSDERCDEYLYKLNVLLETDQELWAQLKRVGEPDILPQLMSIISTTTRLSKPQAIRGDEAVYAARRGG